MIYVLRSSRIAIHDVKCSSFMLALFLPPVFDRLQYAKTEGGWPGRVTCVTSGRYEGRHEGR